MLARCPNCRTTFSADHSGRQDCPACGKPLVVPDAPPVTATPAGDPGPAAAQGTPWERRDQLGFWPAWLQTMQQALFEPGKLFASARLDRGSAQLGFAVLTSSIFSAIGQILERALLSDQREFTSRLLDMFAGNPDVSEMMRKVLQSQKAANTWGVVLLLTLFTPVMSLIFVYLNAGVTHGFALLLGQSKKGFPATFAACAYSCAPLVLLAVPGCGLIISVIWLVVLTGIGLKETHRISPGGAAATVLTPYLLVCCVTLVGAGALMMAMRNVMGPH